MIESWIMAIEGVNNEGSKLLDEAIDPRQYDNSPMWSLNRYGEEAKAREMHFSGYLDQFKARWVDKKFLDIGAGTGWLVAEALQHGAKKSVGIEPSRASLGAARERFPEIELVEAILVEFQTPERFDHIAAIMSLCHMRNLEEAFRKLLALSDRGATIYTVVPNPDHFFQNRYGNQEVTVQKIEKGVWVTKTETPTGPRVEIVRDPNLYTRVATKEGFSLVAEKPMPPTETLVIAAPRYSTVNGPMTHLLVYQAP